LMVFLTIKVEGAQVPISQIEETWM
jgi:hypothetical protein